MTPEIWGPAVWTLFHTLADKALDDHFHFIHESLLHYVKVISKFLPCPYCAQDATKFLSKISANQVTTKKEFKVMLHFFHNHVNKHKKKQIFDINLMDDLYKNKDLSKVIYNFEVKYKTRGNMQLLADNNQRRLIVNDFKQWISKNATHFKNTLT
tara:strand:- start:4542 stop:5006 length:465 start_codon:yes stop_codon:yes gene_type:complete